MIQEFKDFIAKGNVMDMAVGIIIGAAFTAIVTSLVGDLINPIISLFMGGVDFAGQYVLLGEGEFGSIGEAEEAAQLQRVVPLARLIAEQLHHALELVKVDDAVGVRVGAVEE